MKNKNKPSNYSQKNSEKTPSSLLYSLGVAASVSAIIGYLAFDNSQNQEKESEQFSRKNYPSVKVKTTQQEWQEYGATLSINISENPHFSKMFFALIQQESRWKMSAESHSWAKGLWQITSVVFRDMLARKTAYQKRLVELKGKNEKIFHKLPNSLFFALQNINNNISDDEWSEIVFAFRAYYDQDPHTNLLLSALTFDVIYDQQTSEKDAKKFYEEFFQRMKQKKYPINTINKIFSKNSDELRFAFAVWQYNGNAEIIDFDGYQIPERDAHVIRVLQKYHQNT